MDILEKKNILLNGIKDDNRPENLYLVQNSQEHKNKEIKELTCPHCNKIINIKV